MNKGPMFDGVWSHPVLLDLVASALPDFKLFSLNGSEPTQGFGGQDPEGNTVPLHRAYPLRLHRLLLTYLLTVLTILTMRRVACAAHELRGKLLLYLLHLLYLPWQSKAPAKDVTIKYK